VLQKSLTTTNGNIVFPNRETESDDTVPGETESSEATTEPTMSEETTDVPETTTAPME